MPIRFGVTIAAGCRNCTMIKYRGGPVPGIVTGLTILGGIDMTTRFVTSMTGTAATTYTAVIKIRCSPVLRTMAILTLIGRGYMRCWLGMASVAATGDISMIETTA